MTDPTSKDGTIATSLFDLRHTFESAQPLAFFADYDIENNNLVYASDGSVITARHTGTPQKGMLKITSNNIGYAKSDVTKRFRLNEGMEKVYEKINTDEFMERSIKEHLGMRVTLNDPWETTLCFIISQFNNIKRIRKITRAIVNTYGNEIKDDDGKTIGMGFPSSSDLMRATEKELYGCGTGFRAKYIKSAAEYCTNSLDLYKLNPNDYDKLMENLTSIDGVGEKVADCIALMGYGNMDAFPIDVWVKRTIENVYFKGKELKMRYIKEWAKERWKGYAGYAQQYVFWGGRQIEDIKALDKLRQPL
ncbi:MAG: hypothetical protein M1504_01535 [Candidatus Marsarchaeota archaeon]|nr:hypothetical protein [Candidatus Marsarchaeota archaeon]